MKKFNVHFVSWIHSRRIRWVSAACLLGFFGVSLLVSVWGLNGQESFSVQHYGITFSPKYAAYLGLPPEELFDDLIENVGVKRVRLPVYWSDIEPKEGEFQWKELDGYVAKAQEHQVSLTMAIGKKVPRWPECFLPDWAEGRSPDGQQEASLAMIRAVVNRYKDQSAVVRWQVENEPFLPFGICPATRAEDVREEIALVKSLDNRPVQTTAGGEIQPWRTTARMGDVFGISVYRKTWNALFGRFSYPIAPMFYAWRARLIGISPEAFLVSELQAEPWFSEDYTSQSPEYWYDWFTVEDFSENIAYVKEIPAQEVYLWGAEWWAYLRAHGDDRLWQRAKILFNTGE